MTNIGLLAGSLGAESTNAVALAVAGTKLENRGVNVVAISGLEHVPPFVPELVDDPPQPVASLRRQLDALDGLIIAAPEYAAGLAGVTKNALDWLVGASTLYRRLVAVMSVGTTGGPQAIEQMVRTLSWQGALVVATLGIEAPRTKMTAGEITDQAVIGEITALTDSLLGAISGSSTDRRSALLAVVSRYDIDIARFGEI